MSLLKTSTLLEHTVESIASITDSALLRANDSVQYIELCDINKIYNIHYVVYHELRRKIDSTG